MANVIEFHGNIHSAWIRRRCDSRCHNAKSEKCHCICDGKNHGVGTDQAILNTKEVIYPRNQGLPVHLFESDKGGIKSY